MLPLGFHKGPSIITLVVCYGCIPVKESEWNYLNFYIAISLTRTLKTDQSITGHVLNTVGWRRWVVSQSKYEFLWSVRSLSWFCYRFFLYRPLFESKTVSVIISFHIQWINLSTLVSESSFLWRRNMKQELSAKSWSASINLLSWFFHLWCGDYTMFLFQKNAAADHVRVL